MKADATKLDKIFFGTCKYIVPYYQRAYVWGDKQWKRFLEDMEYISATNKQHFFGSMILKQMSTQTGSLYDERTIIDGQQRLTTIAIFFKVLSLKLNKPKIFGNLFFLRDDNDDDDDSTKQLAIIHNHIDRAKFNQITALKELEEIKGEDNLSKLYRYFVENIDESKFVNPSIIKQNMLLVVIDLETGEDEQQIFDTINSLGVKLTTSELLKNHLFNESNEAQYEKYWKPIFEPDETRKDYWDIQITTGTIKRNLIDVFLNSFLQIMIRDFSDMEINPLDKKKYTKVENLFESYKEFLKDYYYKCGHTKEEFLKKMDAYAVKFLENFDPTMGSQTLPATPGIERINEIIFEFDTTTLIPYVLYLLMNVQDDKERNEMFGYIESFIMRRLLVKSNNRAYNVLFTETLVKGKVLTLDRLRECLSQIEDKNNAMPDDDEILYGIHNSYYTNATSTGILYMLETRLRQAEYEANNMLGLNSYSLEHIYPKKWQANWPAPADELARISRDRKILTIGNLAILPIKLNTSISNGDWQTKLNGKNGKSGYQQHASGLKTLQRYLKLASWDEEAIQQRADDLYALMIGVWQK